MNQSQYVAPVEEEFRRFAEGRLEGLALTESEESLELYRKAIEVGLEQLRATWGCRRAPELYPGGKLHALRHRRTEVSRKGVVLCPGENESGKSTIGHLIYFSLAGKGSKGETCEQLINWERNQMNVAASISAQGEVYTLVDARWTGMVLTFPSSAWGRRSWPRGSLPSPKPCGRLGLLSHGFEDAAF